jgi:hypothetical protein
MSEMTKREIMVRAHEIAKTLEGDYIARMSEALRMAWAEARKPSGARLYVNHQPSGGKEWVARIVGQHPKWKFEREFLSPVATNWSSSGRTGTTVFEMVEGGIYEVNEPWKGRRFVTVRNGEIVEIDVAEVLSRVA